MVSILLDFFKDLLGYLGLYNKKANLLFLGLDNAGKSTLLYVLKTNKNTQTSPTQYPHSEELKLGNIKFTTYDVGGHESARKIWKEYFPAIDGIIFIVDSADKNRFPETKDELHKLLSCMELNNIPIAVLGNKIDLEEAATKEELKNALELYPVFIKGDRNIELFMCSVTKKVGYKNAFNWIANFLK